MASAASERLVKQESHGWMGAAPSPPYQSAASKNHDEEAQLDGEGATFAFPWQRRLVVGAALGLSIAALAVGGCLAWRSSSATIAPSQEQGSDFTTFIQTSPRTGVIRTYAEEDRWQRAKRRAKELVETMTLDEKLALLHGPPTCVDFKTCFAGQYVGNIEGNKRVGIPPLHMNDGPQGFRDLHRPGTSTAYPSGLTIAASWDPEIAHEWGASAGREFREKGANVQLGPGVEVCRVPQNGRNFEYLSGEDPYLGSVLVAAAVRGIQSQRVMANAKHFAFNHEETNRGHKAYFYNGTDSAGYSSVVDERTAFEIYYAPFEGAIQAGVGSFMCGYNKIGDGVFACGNPNALKRDLRQRLGFEGFVMSDWGALHSMAITDGLDVEMPGAFWMNSDNIKAGLETGYISQEVVDGAVTHILGPLFAVGVMDEPPSTWDAKNMYKNVTTSESARSARHLSSATTVLLKNEGQLLPLSMQPGQKIALIGFGAENAVIGGGGSGAVYPSHLVTPLEGIQAALGPDVEVVFTDGTDMGTTRVLAKGADYAIVFVGTISHEGADRESLSLDVGCELSTSIDTGGGEVRSKQCEGNRFHQNQMISVVAGANKNTIVVMSVPGAVLMPWAHEVPAILTNFMPGQQVGHALADVIFGKVNPTARLPITFPNIENEQNFSHAQYPGLPYPGIPQNVFYTEKLLIGYRYYDANAIEFTTGFPFGHGLSYTNFTYSDLHVEGNVVSVNVANTGDRHGAEVVQLYLGFPKSAGEPVIQLKGFKKTSVLAPSAVESVSFHLAPKDLSIWDIGAHEWVQVTGNFEVHVGSSSRDLRLSATANFAAA